MSKEPDSPINEFINTVKTTINEFIKTTKPTHLVLIGSLLFCGILIAMVGVMQRQSTDLNELQKQISELETQVDQPKSSSNSTRTPSRVTYSNSSAPVIPRSNTTDTSYIDSQINQLRQEQISREEQQRLQNAIDEQARNWERQQDMEDQRLRDASAEQARNWKRQQDIEDQRLRDASAEQARNWKRQQDMEDQRLRDEAAEQARNWERQQNFSYDSGSMSPSYNSYPTPDYWSGY